MFKNLFIIGVIVSGFFLIAEVGNSSLIDAHVVTNCSGSQVVRTGVGQFEIRHVEPNLPGCIDTSSRISVATANPTGEVFIGSDVISSGSLVASGVVLNCNGNMLTQGEDGRHYLTHTGTNIPGCIHTEISQADMLSGVTIAPSIDLSHGPLLDIRSTQIADYRKKLLRDQNIAFANPVRSVRIRAAATKKSETEAILMKNDAVVDTGDGVGWDPVQGANLEVSDDNENTVTPDTTGKADGYTAAKYLRDPSKSDLVRIGQADFAYWSDIAHTNVAHLVNVRSHPWFGAPVVATLGNLTPLYIISTVDNWSEVRNEEGSIRGYIRSDYLVVDVAQREDNWLGIR